MTLKLLSMNVKGLNSPYKRRALWADAIKFGSDILCIQESHFARDKSPKFQHHKFPHIFVSNHKKKKRGVITAVKDTVSFQQLDLKTDAHGRYIILVASIDNSTYTIVNIYAPNKNPHQFIQKVIKMARKIQKGCLIICGDFNAPLDPDMDTSRKGKTPRKGLADIFLIEDLYDPWRCLHTTEKDFTFFSNVHKSYSRLDYFITDKNLLPKIVDAKIHNLTWSDHAPITIEIDSNQICPNNYLWRNNTFILAQGKHQSVMKESIEEFFVMNDNSSVNDATLWCSHKAYVRGLLIQLTAREKKN